MPASPLRRLAAGLLPAVLAAAVLPGPAAAAPAPADGWLLVPASGTSSRLLSGEADAEGHAAGRGSRAASARAAAAPQVSSYLVDTPGLDEAARLAVLRATEVLAGALASAEPVRVTVRTGPLPQGVLATATPGTYAVRDRNGTYDRTDTLYPIGLANALAGRDLDPSGRDVTVVLADGVAFWSQPEPAPGDRVDLTSVVLGQLVHGLGLLTTLRVQGAGGRWGVPGDPVGPTPVVADRLVVNAAAADAPRSAPLLARALGSRDLATALRAPLLWDGRAARAAAGGSRPALEAPVTPGGVSAVQLREDAVPPGTPDALLTPTLAPGETVRTLGPVTLGMLADVGWGVPSLPGARFTPLPPRRLLDTRTGLGQGGVERQLGPGGVLDLQVTGGTTRVPVDAVAVVLTVTGVAASRSTDLRVYPTPRTPESVPEVSSVNLGRGTTRAASVTVPVGRDGRVRIRNAGGTVAVLADLQGYYATDAATLFHPVTPVRLLDTRLRLSRTIGPGGVLDLQVTGRGGVPATAEAAVLAVTGVGPSRPTDIRVYPTPAGRQPVPDVSTLNLRPGAPVAGLAVVQLGAGGRVRIRNAAGRAAVVVDLAGWFDASTPGGLSFRPVAPQRVFDSRRTRTRRLGPGEAVDVPVTGRGGVPPTARAAVLGLTGIAPSRSTDLRAYPAPSVPGPPPKVSNLNLAPGQTSANAVVVGTGTAGGVRVRNQSGGVAVAVDVTGWFAP